MTDAAGGTRQPHVADASAEGAVRDPDVQDDLDAQLSRIADQLSTLSTAEELPAGFGEPPPAFEPEDVSFNSNVWLLRVIDVQSWLMFEETLPNALGINSPESAAEKLFHALGGALAGQCFVASGGAVRPSLLGANKLASRLDTATFLQARFAELRESLSRRRATEEWQALWDDESEGPQVIEPLKAKTGTWEIKEFADKAARGRLNLSPSYQRGDVWPTGHCQQLIVSILRGIPLPSVILLKPQAEGAHAVYEVVDGKQRLTSILRFIGKHPAALHRINEADALLTNVGFREAFERDYKKFRRLWKTHMGEVLTSTKEAEYYFPFRLPGGDGALGDALAMLGGKYYTEIRDETLQIGGVEETVRDVFESVSDYRIPMIEYIDAAPRQIHDVFHLYNRQGKHLNAEEIRNALFHDLDVMRLLLLAAGDSSNPELAPYLSDLSTSVLSDVAATLTDYGFGTSRYKRTKMLSWLTALIFEPALQDDGTLAVRSTAKHIDSMLTSVREGIDSGDTPFLSDRVRLEELITELRRCLDVHSSCTAWPGKFKDDADGSKWQELQLIASLIGVFLICVVRSDADALMEDRRRELRAFATQHRRPSKTQNRTQWAYIGWVALGIVDTVGIDLSELEAALELRYGVSCLPTLQAAARHYEPAPEPSGA